MAKSELAMPHILKWEGGYANHPKDKGGCTMKGVTIATYQSFYGKNKTCSDLKKITDEQWLHIFESGYWNPCKCSDMKNQSVANIIVDWAWNSGPRTAVKHVQRILGVKDDGIVGDITLTALNGYNQEELFNKIYLDRVKFYIDICERDANQKVFLNGWMNRLNDYSFYEDEIPDNDKKEEKIKEEAYEEVKKHFTDVMLDFGSAFLYK